MLALVHSPILPTDFWIIEVLQHNSHIKQKLEKNAMALPVQRGTLKKIRKRKRSCHSPFMLCTLLKLKMPYMINDMHILLNTWKILPRIIWLWWVTFTSFCLAWIALHGHMTWKKRTMIARLLKIHPFKNLKSVTSNSD